MQQQWKTTGKSPLEKTGFLNICFITTHNYQLSLYQFPLLYLNVYSRTHCDTLLNILHTRGGGKNPPPVPIHLPFKARRGRHNADGTRQKKRLVHSRFKELRKCTTLHLRANKDILLRIAAKSSI